MYRRTKFFIILLFFVFINLAVVCANEDNCTDVSQITSDNDTVLIDDTISNVSFTQNSTDDEIIEKTTPQLTVSSKSVKSKDTLTFNLKNSSGNPLKSKNLTAVINNVKYSLKTNSKGDATLKVNLASKSYKLTVSFDGDDKNNAISKKFTIKVNKLSTKIIPYSNFVIKGKYLYIYLFDQRNDAAAYKKVSVKFNGKTYSKTTNKNGRIKLKVNSRPYYKYSLKVKFKADKQYKSSSKSLKVYVLSKLSLKIGNSRLLTKGYLRVYLKSSSSPLTKKTISINIGSSKFSKKTNSEGFLIIKPKVKAKTYIVKAKYTKYWVCKKIKCIEGNVKDPLKENVSLKNGVPDIDVMPGNYVMGDESGTYTLKKAQYREVLKRDSYCLFLNNKLTKFTFFKTKKCPNTYHILKRTKWNVIERAVNVKLVKANKLNYWPGSITVSLKGKTYSYPEVRDVQGTSYTCGPTSASMCSQVLKNYFSEKYFAKAMGTNQVDGTKCPWIESGLNKNKFNCTYFFKNTFKDALNELQKGGCALIFHADKHYVAILDISKDGKYVLVSNSYGTYDNIPSKWVKASVMKNKFSIWEESLIVRLNYKLSQSTKDTVNCYYNSMGTKWVAKNTNQKMGIY